MKLGDLKIKGFKGFPGFGLKNPVVVVEIGNDWIKIIENNPSARKPYITQVILKKLSHINGAVSDEISEIFIKQKIDKRPVVICIPRHFVTIRILEVPSTDPKEINDMINLQIGKQTPYSKEEIVSAQRVIGEEKEGYTKVMLAIIRRNLIAERVETLNKAGIEVAKVVVSSEGVSKWFNISYLPEITPKIKKTENETGSKAAFFVLVDIDSNYSDFIVVRDGKLIFSRSILIGANHLIGERDNWIDKFVEELQHSSRIYQEENHGMRASKMFLCGAARHIADLNNLLIAKLDMPAEFADPVNNIRTKDGIAARIREEYKFVSVCSVLGTAVKHKEIELDLTPKEVKIKKQMESKRRQLTVTGILFISIVMMISLLILTNIYNKNAYLTQIKQKISKIEKDSNEVAKMRMRIDLVEKRLDAKGTSINILNEVHKLTPKEIHYTNISIEEKDKVVLKGRAAAMSDVFNFVTILEKSPYFENVKTTYTTTKKEKNLEYAEFEIICSYENEAL